MRPLLRTAAFIAALAALTLGAGCKSDCRQLTEKLCECSANSVAKEQCITNAQTLEGQTTLTAVDNARCKTLLPLCDCHQIDTAEGKRNCGLAR